ncbi:MAG TPA: ATP-binding cassette domain-containing protein [Jatrophihabitantaceae bacterium]
MTAAVEVADLSVGYGQTAVVRGLSLHVDEGEFVALLGANGAGKTTTLLALTGVLKPLSGTVDMLGERVRAGRTARNARRGIAMVPEDRGIFSGLTVEENLRLGRRRGRSDDELEFFPELVPLRKRRAGLLSGGEQQMLALARALAAHSALLMIDEMSLGLAPIIVERLLPTLRSIADERGTAILLVEQHLNLALEVADRAYVLSHGELALEGNSNELAQRRDVLEASYLGEMAMDGDRPGNKPVGPNGRTPGK